LLADATLARVSVAITHTKGITLTTQKSNYYLAIRHNEHTVLAELAIPAGSIVKSFFVISHKQGRTRKKYNV
jgi:hypothetical protein